MPPPDDLDRLSPTELKSLVVKQWEQMVELQRLVASLRDEIARLKGGPPRPNLKPSGMERGTEPKPPGGGGGRKHPRGSTRSKLTVHEERTVKVAAPPRGSRFKGYTSFVVQDLVIRPHVVNFRCERWQTSDGRTMTAALPAGIDGHFGPELRRFVLAQYHQGQMTVLRLVTLLRSLGIFISKRQVVRLLIDGQDGFLSEARDVLRAGFRVLPGSRSTTRGRATKPAMVFAPRLATRISLGLAPPRPRAGSTFSSCCAPATTITSSMMRHLPTCAPVHWPLM